MNRPRVIVESPWKADSPEEKQRNIRYLRACLLDCYERGEAPIASHVIGTQCLDEAPDNRTIGIAAGMAWIDQAEIMAVYTDLGTTVGMEQTADYTRNRRGLGAPEVVERQLGERRVNLEVRAGQAAFLQGWVGWDASMAVEALATRCFRVCLERDWSRRWVEGGCYLHLEASEFIEALRGKGASTPEAEAADVLFVLLSVCAGNRVSMIDVLTQLEALLKRHNA